MPVYFRIIRAAHIVYARGLRELGVRAEHIEDGAFKLFKCTFPGFTSE